MTKTLSSRERLSPREQKLVDLVSDQQQSDESSETTSKSVAESTVQPPVGGLHIVMQRQGASESVLLTVVITRYLKLSLKI
jgi:hypothetical protein